MISRSTKALAILVACSLIVAALIGSGCSRTSRKTVTLAGSTAFQPFAEKLAEHYYQLHPEVRINVQGGGSAVGIQSALSGAAEIGMADLLKLPDEAKTLTSTIVARDGIAIVVNPKNPINSITAQQAKDIFSGKIVNWKDLGGMDAVIRVVSREEGSGTRRSFDTLVLGDQKIAPNSMFQDSNGTVRESVSADSNSIGYVSIGLVNEKVKALTYGGVAPIHENVKNKKYSLARPVYFLTKQEVLPHVKDFIDYVISPESQKLLEKEGLIARE